MEEYNQGGELNVTEEFVHPYRHLTFVGFFWKHLRTMRPGIVDKALEAYSTDSGAFLDIDAFMKLKYSDILKQSSLKMFLLFHRILFAFVYKANKKDLCRSLMK